MSVVRRNTSYLFISYFLFSIFLFFLDSRGLLSLVHISVQTITSPFKSALFSARKTALAPFAAISNSEKKDAEIETLRQEKADMLSRLSFLTALKEENERMRYLLGTTLPASWQFSPLRVVGRIGDSLTTTSDLPLDADRPVIVSMDVAPEKRSGVFVGKTGQAVGAEVNIILPTNTQSKIPVIVRSPSGARRASGLLVGRGGEIRLEQVLSSEALTERDLVLTSGEGAPPELLIGFVDKVLPPDSSATRSAEVEAAINTENLDFVFVITKY